MPCPRATMPASLRLAVEVPWEIDTRKRGADDPVTVIRAKNGTVANASCTAKLQE